MRKKTLALGMAVLMMLLAVGCGKNAPDPNAGGGTATAGDQSGGGSTPAPTHEKVNIEGLKLGESADAGPVTLTFNEVGRIDSGTGIPPGYLYVLINVTVKNNGEDPYTINVTEQFKVVGPDGKGARYNIMASGQRSPRLQGTITKDEEKSGWMGFLAKLHEGTYTLHYTHPDYGDVKWEFELPVM